MQNCKIKTCNSEEKQLQDINSELWNINAELQEKSHNYFIFIPWQEKKKTELRDINFENVWQRVYISQSLTISQKSLNCEYNSELRWPFLLVYSVAEMGFHTI